MIKTSLRVTSFSVADRWSQASVISGLLTGRGASVERVNRRIRLYRLALLNSNTITWTPAPEIPKCGVASDR
jgi:hypothetical protein